MPAAANRWIKDHLPPEVDAKRAALENIPSPVAFGWSARGTITIVAGPQNTPVFPFAASEADHALALAACRAAADRLLAQFAQGGFNVRADYRQSLEYYCIDLPKQPGEGNILLADMEARALREMFAADAAILPEAFAARLKILLQNHMSLRVFYPEIARFYEAVQTGRVSRPLPIDAVDGVKQLVVENTPRFLERDISQAIEAVERPEPVIVPAPEDIRPTTILPPPDPLGEIEPQKARSFGLAAIINGLLKIVSKGKQAGETAEGWAKFSDQFKTLAGPIIDWLLAFLPPST